VRESINPVPVVAGFVSKSGSKTYTISEQNPARIREKHIQ
jgi:hypothetical protein